MSFRLGKSPTHSRQSPVPIAARCDMNCLHRRSSPKTAPVPGGHRMLLGERGSRRMEEVTRNQQWLRTEAADNRAIAPSGSVEPKHWYPAYTCISTLQDAGPETEASIRFGEVLVTAREVPQSAPDQTDGADYRNNRGQQGAEPVRFSNGQHWT